MEATPQLAFPLLFLNGETVYVKRDASNLLDTSEGPGRHAGEHLGDGILAGRPVHGEPQKKRKRKRRRERYERKEKTDWRNREKESQREDPKS